MKELIFECDLCLSRGQHVVATHVAVEVSIGSVQGMLIDLCQKDHDTLLAPVIDTLAKYGYRDTPVKKRKKASA